ncbi:MAG: ComF family protein [Tannerella sp.]|jgi:ComF family protein|nr:ComF family protein [Tannerella sp.]
MIKHLFNLFYPKPCLICRKTLKEHEEFICLDCFSALPKTNYHKLRSNKVSATFLGYSHLKEATAYLHFAKESSTQQLIHALKYYGNRSLGVYLGRLAAVELKNAGYFTTVDAIIPIPLHEKKERKRGYNQSVCIAQGIASIYGCSIDTATVCRHIDTQTQTRKNAYDRHLNVENIFILTSAESLIGKHVLLIDDVMTTGSTIMACIDVLTAVPDITISIFALSVAGE